MNFLLNTLAHPGHDHSFSLGGEWHHLLWIAGGLIVAGCITAMLSKQRSR